MNLGKIIGTVVATSKDPSLIGVKLLLMQPLDEKLEKVGVPVVAADPIGARPGDVIMWASSREAALALENKFAPVDHAVVGIVDMVNDKRLEP